MNKYVGLLLMALVFASINVKAQTTQQPIYQYPALTCSQDLAKSATAFVDTLLEKTVLFSTLDGIEYNIKFKRNSLGVNTAELFYTATNETIKNLYILNCIDQVSQSPYLMIYADNKSPVGTYVYELKVLIPQTDKLFKTPVDTLVDLRKGTWSKAKMMSK